MSSALARGRSFLFLVLPRFHLLIFVTVCDLLRLAPQPAVPWGFFWPIASPFLIPVLGDDRIKVEALGQQTPLVNVSTHEGARGLLPSAPGIDHLVIAWTVDLDHSLRDRAGCVFVTDPDWLASLEGVAFVVGTQQPVIRLRYGDKLGWFVSEGVPFLQWPVMLMQIRIDRAPSRWGAKSNPCSPAHQYNETQNENVHAPSAAGVSSPDCSKNQAQPSRGLSPTNLNRWDAKPFIPLLEVA